MTAQMLINGDLLPKEGHEEPLFYRGEVFKIIGPLEYPIDTMGLLKPNSEESMKEVYKCRKTIDEITDSNKKVDTMKFVVSGKKENKSLVIVGLPPESYVNLSKLNDAEVIFSKEVEKGIYIEDVKINDFWVDPESKRLFLVGIDKVKTD